MKTNDLHFARVLSVGVMALAIGMTGIIFPVHAENEPQPGSLYTDAEGNYYYEPLEQGVYSNGGYTIEKVSHSTDGPGVVDGIVDPKESGQSYSWSMATEGDYVYIGTCYNSTYYIYYNNVASSLNTMKNNGTISKDVDVESTAKSILRVAFGTDSFANEEFSPMSWNPVIMAVNKNTGEAKVIFRESDIRKDYPDIFMRGINALSGYRMAFKFHGKIYFAGMGNPTATLVEVNPETNEAKIVYHNTNVRSQNASAYSGVSNGVHGLLVFDDEILMCLATDNLQKFDPNAEAVPGGIIVGSKDPSAGLSSWRTVATSNDFDNLPAVMQIDGLNGGGIWDMVEYDGKLYVTIVTDKTDTTTGKTNKQGFALYCGTKQEDGSFTWEQLAGNKGKLPFGFGIDYSMSCNMWVYNDYLYFGTYNDPMLDLAAVPSRGDFEDLYNDLDHSIYLYRMDKNGNFEMVAGKNDNPVFPNGPVGNLGAGLGNNSNQYVWRYGEHNGELYIGTYDTSSLTYMFTQFTDGQVENLSEEEMQARTQELENALLEVLQKKDSVLLDKFLSNTILSPTSQKLFQKLSGLATGLSKDWNPVPEYRKGLESYEEFKQLILGEIDALSTYSSEEENDELYEIISEVMDEENTNAITTDEFIESLSEEELIDLYTAEFPEEAVVTMSADDNEPAVQMSHIKDKLKEKLKELVSKMFESTDVVVYDQNLHNFIYYFGTNYYAQQCEKGFDLLVSNDGVNFDAITRNGFGDGENHGLRTIGSTDTGVFMGTANPFHATQLWKMSSDADTPKPTETPEPSAEPTQTPSPTTESTVEPTEEPVVQPSEKPQTSATPSTSIKQETKKESKTAKTSDSSDILIYAGITAAMAIVAGIITCVRRTQ